MTGSGFRALVLVQPMDAALPRLRGTPELRRSLALAFAQDTTRAVVRCRQVREVVVLCRDAEVRAVLQGPAVRAVEPAPGTSLNAVITGSLAEVRGRPMATAVLTGDLPALMADELGAALGRVSGAQPSVYVDELLGDGTTFFASRQDAFRPFFGPRSTARNDAAGSLRIGGDLPGLRCAVRDNEGLSLARYIGVGQRTSEILARHPELGVRRVG